MTNVTSFSLEAVTLIQMERFRQDTMYPEDVGMASRTWLNILVEEVGEVAKEIMESNSELLKKELIQVGAVAHAWLEDILRQEAEECRSTSKK